MMTSTLKPSRKTIRISVAGIHLLSGATDEDPFVLLAQAWWVILRGIVSPQSMSYFQEFVIRTA